MIIRFTLVFARREQSTIEENGSGVLWSTEAHVETTLSAALDPVLFPFEIARVASEHEREARPFAYAVRGQ